MTPHISHSPVRLYHVKGCVVFLRFTIPIFYVLSTPNICGLPRLCRLLSLSPSPKAESWQRNRTARRVNSFWLMLRNHGVEQTCLSFFFPSPPTLSSRHELSEYIATPLFKKQPPQQWVAMVTQHMQQVQALNPHQARAQFLGKIYTKYLEIYLFIICKF